MGEQRLELNLEERTRPELRLELRPELTIQQRQEMNLSLQTEVLIDRLHFLESVDPGRIKKVEVYPYPEGESQGLSIFVDVVVMGLFRSLSEFRKYLDSKLITSGQLSKYNGTAFYLRDKGVFSEFHTNGYGGRS